jgi:RHS repeat-associated protein
VKAIISGDSVRFDYDPLGQPVVRRGLSGEGMRVTLYDGGSILADLDSAGNRVGEYVYDQGTDRPYALLKGATTVTGAQYFVQDDFGNVTGTLLDSVTVGQRVTYDGNGLPAVTGDQTNRLMWKGAPYDKDLLLTQLGARWYDPYVMRFISEDPLGLAGGINPYVYANNDPVNGSDPSGMSAQITCATYKIWQYDLATGEQVGDADYETVCSGDGDSSGGGGGGGGTGSKKTKVTDPYPYKAVRKCPDFLQPGQPIRAGLDQLYAASRKPVPHEEAMAFYTTDGRVNFMTVGTGNCKDVQFSPDINGALPVNTIMFAHSHPCTGMNGGGGLVYGQGPDYGDVALSTAYYRKPGAIVSRDSLFWYNPDGKAYGCAR